MHSFKQTAKAQIIVNVLKIEGEEFIPDEHRVLLQQIQKIKIKQKSNTDVKIYTFERIIKYFKSNLKQ